MSPFGTPFIIGRDSTRDGVIARYKAWLLAQPQQLARLPSPKGKHLVCWCASDAWHADVPRHLANTPARQFS